MVALDLVFLRANLTPQENAGFRANSAIFIPFFPLFIIETIQGRDWKVGLDDNTGLTCKYLSYGKLCRCFHRLRGGEERVGQGILPTCAVSGYFYFFLSTSFCFFPEEANIFVRSV